MSSDLLDKYPVGSPEWVYLNGVGDLQESSELSGLSVDTLKRRYPNLILNLSLRRRGMKRHVALSIGKSRTA